jgi:VanZ family protein
MKTQYKYLLLVGWMLLIFMLSGEGAGDSRARSGAIVALLTDSFASFSEDLLMFLIRKSAHIIAYFILGILVYSIAKMYKFSTKRTIVLSILFALSYAVFDEIHQLFDPGRSGEIRDVLIDTTAASVGISAYYLGSRMRYNRLNSKNKI